jgi:alkanesulfonate monooxygenase SsuD/methylene tetrahydromethanopterin reductase-like flavin-dependent oxidoreductase (luciferase family)
VREIGFLGDLFRSRGRHFVAPSPQRRPVLWQAGSSQPGREFASKQAESVFGIFPTPKSMRTYADDIRSRAAQHGRDLESVKLIYGLQTIIDRDRGGPGRQFTPSSSSDSRLRVRSEFFRTTQDSTFRR